MSVTLQVDGREVKKPTEEEWFEVNPQAIDQSLFKEKRWNYRQEVTRKLIIEAFEMVERYPNKYGRNFKTLIPKKKWGRYYSYDAAELNKWARERGGHMADWCEQALEWAQRINNGESWKDVCENPDLANWCRVVIWKDNWTYRIVGGSTSFKVSASFVSSYSYDFSHVFNDVVPLIVKYD